MGEWCPVAQKNCVGLECIFCKILTSPDFERDMGLICKIAGDLIQYFPKEDS